VLLVTLTNSAREISRQSYDDRDSYAQPNKAYPYLRVFMALSSAIGSNSRLFTLHVLNRLTPKNVQRRRAVSPLKIKIASKHMRVKIYTNYLFSLLIMCGSFTCFGITLPSLQSVPSAFLEMVN
jgi:hypothetical protein